MTSGFHSSTDPALYLGGLKPLREDGDAVTAVQIISIDTTDHFHQRRRLHQQTEILEAIHATALGLMRRLNPPELLSEIVTRAADLAGTDHGFVYLVDGGGQAMTMVVGTGIYRETMIGVRLARGEGLAGTIWQTGAPLRVADYSRWENRSPNPLFDDVHALLGVPIGSGGAVIGVIGLGRCQQDERPFSDQDEALMIRFAELAGIALDNARLHARLIDELRHRKDAEAVLLQTTAELDVSNRISTLFLTATEESLFNRVLGIIMEMLDSPYGYFGYVDEGGDLVTPSLTETVWDECRIPGKNIVFARSSWTGIWGRSLLEKKTLWANTGLCPPQGHVPLTAALASPIICRGEVIGQFAVANKPGGYLSVDAQRLEHIAARVAPVLAAWLERRRLEGQKAALEGQLRQLQKMEAPGTHVCLTVSDTGHGMDAPTLERIFDPYFSTKDKDKGTGLGLAVVHGIVRSYRGDIAVRSQPGKGSVFEIFLPSLSEVPVLPDNGAAPAAGAGSESIMIVDDEPAITLLVAQMLQRKGYRVTPLASGAEALSAFRQDPRGFDLVLTDMTMPGMTGDRLCLELKRIRSDIPVIICTGYSDSQAEAAAEAAGALQVLVKPLALSELSAAVRQALDRRGQ